jgi:hypothetical protein
MNYSEFLDSKTHSSNEYGFDPLWIPDSAFDFQESLLEWSLRRGRSGIFADCGLGKTLIELAWAENVVRKTNGRILNLTPLAVAHQTVTEADKFGIEVHRSHHGELHDGIVVANYERLHLFNPADFVGIVCDESSILKSFDGKTRAEVTDFSRKLPYRLLATATAAPNDYVELGTSSEALGELGHMDMLNRFFKNDQNNSATGRLYGEATKWRFKGHAEIPFWRWVTSWARACRRPSDLGFDDNRFILPPLNEREHVVEARTLAEGMLFALPAVGLKEQREERRRTIQERCEKIAQLVDHDQAALVWCHLNDEGDLLEELVKDCVQVSGDDSDEEKEEKFIAFTTGEAKKLVTKQKIGAWGLNFQHCSHVAAFPSHSYEQYYQGVRRCWRFGQTKPVNVDIVMTEGERSVMENMKRKARQADKMFSHLVAEMNNSIKIEKSQKFTKTEEVPSWL